MVSSSSKRFCVVSNFVIIFLISQNVTPIPTHCTGCITDYINFVSVYRIRQNIRGGKLLRFSRILAKREFFTIEIFPALQLDIIIFRSEVVLQSQVSNCLDTHDNHVQNCQSEIRLQLCAQRACQTLFQFAHNLKSVLQRRAWALRLRTAKVFPT